MEGVREREGGEEGRKRKSKNARKIKGKEGKA